MSTDQDDIVKSVRATLQRYAFIFTAIGVVITAINFGLNWIDKTYEQGSKLSSDGSLYEGQFYLKSHSDGGTNYLVESNSDERFNSSLSNLFNYYETSAKQANSWSIIKPVYANDIKCSLGKHVKIFLLGESNLPFWTVDGAFIPPEVVPETMKLYEYIKPTLDECIPIWQLAVKTPPVPAASAQ